MEAITTYLLNKLYILPGILIGLSFHEFAHAKTASLLGDPTAENMGRVSLNPLAHFDILGFLCLLIIGFGWGKPVMVNPNNFDQRHRRRSQLIVSSAGIIMNLILSVVFMGIMRVLCIDSIYGANPDLMNIIIKIVQDVVVINLSLMIFNLIPVPPLDGYNILTEALDKEFSPFFQKLYQIGPMILLALLIFNVVDLIMTPCVNFMYNALLTLFGF